MVAVDTASRRRAARRCRATVRAAVRCGRAIGYSAPFPQGRCGRGAARHLLVRADGVAWSVVAICGVALRGFAPGDAHLVRGADRVAAKGSPRAVHRTGGRKGQRIRDCRCRWLWAGPRRWIGSECAALGLAGRAQFGGAAQRAATEEALMAWPDAAGSGSPRSPGWTVLGFTAERAGREAFSLRSSLYTHLRLYATALRYTHLHAAAVSRAPQLGDWVASDRARQPENDILLRPLVASRPDRIVTSCTATRSPSRAYITLLYNSIIVYSQVAPLGSRWRLVRSQLSLRARRALLCLAFL